jgi:hypothetical protein
LSKRPGVNDALLPAASDLFHPSLPLINLVWDHKSISAEKAMNRNGTFFVACSSSHLSSSREHPPYWAEVIQSQIYTLFLSRRFLHFLPSASMAIHSVQPLSLRKFFNGLEQE